MCRSSKTNLSRRLGASAGKGTFGCVFSLALLGVAIFVTMRIGPPYLSYKGLESDIKAEAARAGAHFLTDEVVTKEVISIAEKNDVRLTSENIKVRRFADQLEINVHYATTVDFIVYQRDLEFEIKASSYIGRL